MKKENIRKFTMSNWVLNRVISVAAFFYISLISIDNRNFPIIIGWIIIIAIVSSMLHSDYKIIKYKHEGFEFYKLYLTIYILSLVFLIIAYLWGVYIGSQYNYNYAIARKNNPYLSLTTGFVFYYGLSFIFLPPLCSFVPRKKSTVIFLSADLD